MKKIICAALCAIITAQALIAEKPQIAFRLLDDYIAKEQKEAARDKKVGGVIGLSAGVLFLGASAATWFYGDRIYGEYNGGAAMNPNVKLGVTLGLAAGGGLSLWSGIDSIVRPTKDLKLRYADVYDESDPEVQEAMAVATLQNLSVKYHGKRISSVITNLLTSSIAIGVAIGGNINDGFFWSDGLESVLLGQSYSLASGIARIFVKSDEELLYQQYLTAREALYSSPSYGKGDDDEPKADKPSNAKKNAKSADSEAQASGEEN